MIPRVIFRHSHSYDGIYKDIHHSKSYPKEQEITKYINNVQGEWIKINKKILKEIERITGLEFKDDKIICYIVGKAIPIADPLTIPFYKNTDHFIDTLIHELIHILFTQYGNLIKAKNSWKYIFNKYKDESFETKIHIPLHAVHTHIYTTFFSIERLEHDIKDLFNLKTYRRSWQIVTKDGHANIIQEFVNRLS